MNAWEHQASKIQLRGIGKVKLLCNEKNNHIVDSVPYDAITSVTSPFSQYFHGQHGSASS